MSPTTHNYLLDLICAGGKPAGFKSVRFAPGQSIGVAGEPISEVIFPTQGLIACTVQTDEGAEIETALIGEHSAFGGSAVFGGLNFPCDGVACVPGIAWSLPVHIVTGLARGYADAHGALWQNELFLWAQARTICACAATHPIRSRFATWLLRASDVSGKDEIFVTQDNIARWLGVQRASISMVASAMREQGCIEYRRGHLWITDRGHLEEEACGCARAMRQQRARFAGTLDISVVQPWPVNSPIA